MVDTNKILNTLDDSQEAEAFGPKVALELDKTRGLIENFQRLGLIDGFRKSQISQKKVATPNATIKNDGGQDKNQLKVLASESLGNFFKAAPGKEPAAVKSTATPKLGK